MINPLLIIDNVDPTGKFASLAAVINAGAPAKLLHTYTPLAIVTVAANGVIPFHPAAWASKCRM
jgi:hypothetical protein